MFKRISGIAKYSILDRYEANVVYNRYYELCKEDIISDRMKEYLLDKESEHIKALKKQILYTK